MAEMVPETLPASSTAGEKRVFAALERLPEDCLVYYEPVVRGRYPDLIVILTKGGPGHGTEILSSYGFMTAYAQFDFGYAGAISVVMLVLLLAFAAIYVRVSGVTQE